MTRLSCSHTFRSDPFGLGGRKPSGIPSAAILRSQCFGQFQLSYPTESRWVPAPRCEVRSTTAHRHPGNGCGYLIFPQSGIWTYKAALEESVVLIPLEATLERNCASQDLIKQ